MSIADFSLGSPSLRALRNQAMTGRFRASSPGCSSQPTTPIEADVRGPWQRTAAVRVSGYVSHQGQGPGSAHRKGCPGGCPEPPSASLACPPWPTESWLKTPTSRKASKCFPYLWPAGLHFSGSGFSLVSLPLVPVSRALVNASTGFYSFLHLPVASRGRRPKDGGTREKRRIRLSGSGH